MPTFSRSLEQSLHRALALANERHHEYVNNVDIDKLRGNLVTYVESELEKLATDGSEDSKPTAGLQRTIQHAVIHVQSSGHEQVTGANVLVAWPGPYATSKISSTTFNNAASP
jgi:ATP-dependent Clp protease ATP-binding subunit ClpA